MKVLKYVLAFIGILLLFFFGKGLLTPSVYYECEIEVNKSAKEAWAVMSDEEYLPQWIEGFQKAELVSGKENTVGAVSNVYIDQDGQKSVMKETISNIKLHELMAMDFTTDFMNMEYQMTFVENAGKTTIKTTSKTIGNGLLAKSMISFMPSAMQAQEEKNLGSLKKLIDNNTKDYFPEPTINLEES